MKNQIKLEWEKSIELVLSKLELIANIGIVTDPLANLIRTLFET